MLLPTNRHLFDSTDIRVTIYIDATLGIDVALALSLSGGCGLATGKEDLRWAAKPLPPPPPRTALTESPSEATRRRATPWPAIFDGAFPRQAIIALAKSFPALRGVDVDPWDPQVFYAWATSGISHGEKCAAQFVLGVWNPSTDWDELYGDDEHRLGSFNVFDAIGVWDDGNRRAFLQWVKEPFWP